MPLAGTDFLGGPLERHVSRLAQSSIQRNRIPHTSTTLEVPVIRVVYGSLVVAVVACGSGPQHSSPVITSLLLETSTDEQESGRWLLTVGDTGLVRIDALQTSDCFFDSRCAASVHAQRRS